MNKILTVIESLSASVRDLKQAQASYRWATVVGVDPLRVRFDGDVEDLAASPVNLAGSLSAQARVRDARGKRRRGVWWRACGHGGVFRGRDRAYRVASL